MSPFPKYTVFTNIDCGDFIGMSWEFFRDEGQASLCYQRHKAAGHVPSIRAFHKNDIKYMGAADRFRLEELCHTSSSATDTLCASASAATILSKHSSIASESKTTSE